MRVARTATLLGLAHLGYKLVGLGFFALLPRTLSPQDVGRYLAAVALTQLVVLLTGLGLPAFVLRESALGASPLPGALGLRLATAALTLVALPFDPALVGPLLVAALAEDTYRSFGAALVAADRADRNVAIGIVAQLAWIGVAAGGLLAGGGLRAVIAAEVLRGTILAIGGWIAVGRPTPRWAPGLLDRCLPFAGAAAGSTLANDLHPVLLAAVAGTAPVAAFGLAHRVLLASLFVPTVLGMATAPRAAQGSVAPRIHLGVGLAGGFAMLPLVVAPGPIARILFGPAGDEVARVLPWLALAIPFAWTSTYTTQVLQAVGGARAVATGGLLGSGLAAAVDAVAVPIFGTYGALAGRLAGTVATAGWLERARRSIARERPTQAGPAASSPSPIAPGTVP